jgi:hypothetical protein
MKTGLVLILLCVVTSICFAQNERLIPCRKGNLWGYCDENGKTILEHKYERTWFFSPDGVARVKNKGLFGFINREGKLLIIPRYASASDYHMGLAKINNRGKEFCINLEGDEEPCEPPEEMNEDPEEEANAFTFIPRGNQLELILTGSSDTIPGLFDDIKIIKRYSFPTVHQFALVSKKGYWGGYNETGTAVAPIEFEKLDILDMQFYKGKLNNRWGVRKFSGEIILPFEYDSIVKVVNLANMAKNIQENEHFIVGKNGKYGVMNEDNEFVLPLVYDEIVNPEPCTCEAEYVVKQGKYFGLANSNGELILPVKYMRIEPFRGHSITLVHAKSNREGYVNKNGREYFTEQ